MSQLSNKAAYLLFDYRVLCLLWHYFMEKLHFSSLDIESRWHELLNAGLALCDWTHLLYLLY